jgi:hypothetical protein
MRRYPSAKDLARIIKPGRYAVGHGAYLQIAAGGTRSWLFRYRIGDQQHHMGLGSCDYLSLAEARERAIDAQRQRLNGIDPLGAKRTAKREQQASHLRAMTFNQCAMAYIAAHEPSWRGNHSRRQWTQSLQNHVFPVIGDLPVSGIDTPRVMSVLEPIWTQVPETARRIRNRIELIIDYATAHGIRTGDNPARWRGLLENLLPEQRRANGVKHLAAMPWRGCVGPPSVPAPILFGLTLLPPPTLGERRHRRLARIASAPLDARCRLLTPKPLTSATSQGCDCCG